MTESQRRWHLFALDISTIQGCISVMLFAVKKRPECTRTAAWVTAFDRKQASFADKMK